MSDRFLKEDGLQQVISAFKEKFTTKLDTLMIQDKSITPDKNAITLQHISVEETPTGVVLKGEEVASYNIVSNSSEEFATVYEFQKTVDGNTETLSTINIPKDFFLTNVQTSTVTEEDKEEGGKFANDDNYVVGDHYIDFTVGVKNGRKVEERHFYINYKDIMPNNYTGGTAIQINADNTINVKYDTDVMFIKEDGTLSIKEANGSGQKGIIRLPNENGDYFININEQGNLDYTKSILFTTDEINNLFT